MLNKVILNIIFAVLTYFKSHVHLPEKFQGSVGMKILLFSFKMAIKIAGSAQKIRVGRVCGNTAIFFFGLIMCNSFWMKKKER